MPVVSGGVEGGGQAPRIAGWWPAGIWLGLAAAPYVIYITLVAFTLVIRHDGALPVWASLTRIILACLASAFSVAAALHPGLDQRQRRPWRYVAGAMVALIVTDIIATIPFLNTLISGTAAATATQLIHLLFTALLLRALFLFAGPRRQSGAQRRRLALDCVIVLGGGAVWMWYFIFGPALARPHSSWITVWQGASATVAHLLVIFALSVILLRGTTTSARTPMLLLLGSTLISFVISLSIVNGTLNHGRPTSEDPFVIGWPIPLALIASAAIEQCRLAARGQQSVQRVLAPPTWLPYAGVGVGFIALGVASARATPFPWWGLVGGTVVTTIAVLSRQFLALRENDRLVARDGVTGLASRTHLLNRMTQLAESGSHGVVVLQIDLDGFKKINDEYGHEVGDAYLAAFGAVMRENIRHGDLAARVGGDEFAVLLAGVPGPEEGIAIAERILRGARRSTEIAGHQMSIRASIGIARCGETLDVDLIMRQADQAMYTAKRRGSHSWELYSENTVVDGK